MGAVLGVGLAAGQALSLDGIGDRSGLIGVGVDGIVARTGLASGCERLAMGLAIGPLGGVPGIGEGKAGRSFKALGAFGVPGTGTPRKLRQARPTIS